jgi:uncharacterized protein YacL
MKTRDSHRQVARSSSARLLRYVGLLVGLILGWQIGARIARSSDSIDLAPVALLFAAIGGGLLFIATPYLILASVDRLRRHFSSIPAIDIMAAGIGLIVGGVVSSLLAFPVSLLPDPYGQVLPFAVAVIACFIGVFVVVLRRDDLGALVTRGGSAVVSEKLLLDTSVIIDGRILALMRTGVITMPLTVPSFVLRELQGIADSADPNKKIRGRRGLDVLEQLQREELADVEIVEIEIEEESTVDNMLIRLAALSQFHIFTGDQNLEKVARVQGVQVVNVNALAQALRPPVVAGEELELEIVQPGRETGQGIGFLDDGTLVVVEDAMPLVGRDVRVVVTRMLQTGTGRMAFAQIKSREGVT